MNRKKENQENEGEYENVLRDRKLKYENLRKKSTLHNRFMSPIFNLINSAINFLKTLFNIAALPSAYPLRNNSVCTALQQMIKMGTLQKSRMMELKNLGTCLGSS
eukprot:XP_002260956.1 hypothetical protein, conserved in Plasmodium species [Plasmodium knowlesi strain H]